MSDVRGLSRGGGLLTPVWIPPVLLAGLWLAAVWFGGALPVAAQEYSLQGDVELGVLWVPDAVVSGSGLLNAEHRFVYDWGEFSVQHRLAALAGSMQVMHQLNQAAVEVWPSDGLTLLAGRFSLPWGMGYLFHPGDALHPVRTPDGNVPGFDGAAVSWAFSPEWNATAVVRADTAFAGLGSAAADGTDGATDSETETDSATAAAPAGTAGDELAGNLRWAGQVSGYFSGVQAEAAGVYQPDTVLRPSGSMSIAWGPVVLHAEAAVELIGGDAGLAGIGEVVTSMGGGVAAADILGGSEGWAAVTGGNYALYLGNHTISMVAEYLAAQQTGDAAGSGDSVAEADFRQLLYPMLEWNWDRRVFLEQSGLVDLETGQAVLMTAVRGSFFDSLEVAAEGVTLLEDAELHFSGLRVYTRVFF